MDRLLLKPHEAAEILGVSLSKTYELIASNTIPSIVVGSSWRVPADALRDWVKRQLADKQQLVGQAV